MLRAFEHGAENLQFDLGDLEEEIVKSFAGGRDQVIDCGGGVIERRVPLKKAGKDFHLAFSPEREDPNNQDFSTSTIPKVVGGVTPACTEHAALLYGQTLGPVVPVSSTRVAEMVKLLENTFRSVNIGLVNEIALMSDRMGIDVWEVIEAAATKPFGFMPFYPGPGLGGHCIPIDPFYLTWKAREYDISTRFIELAGEQDLELEVRGEWQRVTRVAPPFVKR